MRSHSHYMRRHVARNSRLQRPRASSIVMQSSTSDISEGHNGGDAFGSFTWPYWNIVDGPGLQAHEQNTTLAEHAAWDSIEMEGAYIELCVIDLSLDFETLAPNIYIRSRVHVKTIRHSLA